MNPVEEFLGLKKEGGFWGNLATAFKTGLSQAAPKAGTMGSMSESLARGMGSAFPYVALTAAGGAALHGIGKGVGAVKERFSKAKDYQMMLEHNPTLKGEDAGHVQSLYNSLRSMSPTMSKDPIIAGSFIKNTIRLSPESGPSVDPMTAKLLSETERNVSQARGGNPVLDAVRAKLPSAINLPAPNEWEAQQEYLRKNPQPPRR